MASVRVRLTGTSIVAAVAAAAAAMAWPGVWVRAQESVPSTVDWPLHSFDARGSRSSPLTQINTSNAARLAVKWQAQPGGTFAEETPIVVNGVMYLNAGSKLYALNAATGEPVDLRGFHPFRGARITTERLIRLIVGEDEQNVGPIGLRVFGPSSETGRCRHGRQRDSEAHRE